MSQTNFASPLANGLPDGALAMNVAKLLEEAGNAFDRDLASARSYIQRAHAMLTGAYDEQLPPENGGLAVWQIKKVKAFIAANIEGTIRIEDVAVVSRLSVSHFSRAFRRSFGKSPHAYVLEQRIAYAQSLLVSTGEPLSQIAISCGMADQAHFSRLFRKLTGETPSRWRRANLVID